MDEKTKASKSFYTCISLFIYRKMIDEDATKEAFGYYSTDLPPHSNNPIKAACDDCGKVRTTLKYQYRALCRSCTNIGRHHTEETKAKIGAGNKGKIVSEKTKALMSVAHKCNTCTLGHTLTVEHKAKISLANSGKKNHNFGKHRTEETRAKMSAAQKGEKGNNWQGGVSFAPYCEKFNEAYKQLIRNKFDNKCFWCGTTRKENGRALDVHHVNYNKNCGCDKTKCICVPLCMKCHGSSGLDRVGWQEKIMMKLELSGIV
ncbi:MAG: hypothetical protein IMF19_00895 [Proteobacteria bacterium]|nr:hypothetical protein [Pseudomonadota bacterium]